MGLNASVAEFFVLFSGYFEHYGFYGFYGVQVAGDNFKNTKQIGDLEKGGNRIVAIASMSTCKC